MSDVLDDAVAVGDGAAQYGFDWPDVDSAFLKIDEEVAELREAIAGGEKSEIADELGDLLFAVANVGRKLELQPSVALKGTLEKFNRRFSYVMERIEKFEGSPRLPVMEEWWEEAKNEEFREKNEPE